MQRLEVSGAVQPIYVSLGVKRLSTLLPPIQYTSQTQGPIPLRILIYILPNGTYIAILTEASTDENNVNNFYCVYILFNDNKCFKHSGTINLKYVQLFFL